MIKFLQSIKLSVQRSPAHGVLKRLGVLDIGRAVYNRRILRAGRHSATILGTELKFVVSSPDEILQIDGLFSEHEFLSRTVEGVGAGGVFYDIGANIGLFGLLVAARGRQNGVRVVCFEPEPSNARRLKENVMLNGVEGVVTVEQAGVGAAPGKIRLFLAGYIGDHSMLADRKGGGESVEVPLVSIDEYCRTHGSPTAMKIDVEGFELEVLRGASETLRSGVVKDIFLELHVEQLKAAGIDPAQVYRFVEERGFRSVWSSPRGGETHEHFRYQG